MISLGNVPGCGTTSPSRWTVVVPVKSWAAAKSRLATDPATRANLARAFALDVVEAARSTRCVDAVLVVSGEPALRTLFATARCGPSSTVGGRAQVLVVDDAGRGLDDSVRLGATRARLLCPEICVAVLTADLPALRPDDLATVLETAAGHRLAAVADAEGTGTTVLTATTGADVRPAFGSGSFTRHRDLGAIDVSRVAAPGVRRDVDVDAHLRAARRLGVGVHTAALKLAC